MKPYTLIRQVCMLYQFISRLSNQAASRLRAMPVVLVALLLLASPGAGGALAAETLDPRGLVVLASALGPDWSASPTPAAAPSAPVSTPVPTPVVPAPAADPYCGPGEQPQFRFGFATLGAQLGARMGSPSSCEYGDPRGSGDTLQMTDKGLGFYRQSTNTPTFTTGSEHWALTEVGLVYWSGDNIDPHGDAQPAGVHPCLATGTARVQASCLDLASQAERASDA